LAPTVTIGLPFRNDASTLALAVRSVFAQTYTDWEMLLVDDGSNDGSRALALSIRDPRVRVLGGDGNHGLATRLNAVAAEARGEFVVRMDADDVMAPHRVELQVAYLRQHADVDLVGSAAYAIDQANTISGVITVPTELGLPATLLRSGAIIHPTVTARTAWMRTYRYDETFRVGQDKELWLRAALTSRLENLPEPLLFYRLLGGFNIEKYRGQKAVDRRLLLRYGRARVGLRRATVRYAAALGKTAFYELAHRTGRIDLVQRLANRGRVLPCQLAELKRAEVLLNNISLTCVPGWNDRDES
jgi:glycosyltransferase involved in cell wall biosynthesis